MVNPRDGSRIQNTSNIGTKISVHLLTKEKQNLDPRWQRKKKLRVEADRTGSVPSEALSLPMLSRPFTGHGASTLSRRRRYPQFPISAARLVSLQLVPLSATYPSP
ncbi:hypothetical protein OIU79_018866 [Salix purpurea]|uniref:Uncharacterized protein n=1 Tax=Salix purpurea TaxID=77065 RepID=A0A9Q0NZU3_SALPP|nr:hypothetical protein OIU79_018866 [Salix purpurea]